MATRLRWIVSGLLVVVGGAAQAQYVGPEIDEKWLPSLSMSFGVHSQAMDVSGVSSLGWQAGQHTTVITSMFNLEAGVATPVLVSRRGSPRVYGVMGAQIPMSSDFPIQNRLQSFPAGASVTAEVCPVGTIVSGSEVRSCDQTLRVQMKLNVAWTAGVGVDFTLPIHDRKIYLRTGVQYFGEWLDFEGFGERTDRGSGPDAINQPGVPLAVTTICCATTTTTLHALGPRLGINAEAARVGPVGLHVFAEVSAYWYLNPDVIEFGAVTPSGEAAYSVRPYPFVGQGAAGVRIVWSPN